MRCEPELRQEPDERVVEGAQPRRDHRLVEHTLHGGAEARHLARLLREGLDHADTGDVLLRLGRELGDPLLDLLARRPVQPAVASGDDHHERDRRQRDDGEAGVHREHDAGGDQDRQRRLQDEHEAVAEEEADRLQVDRRARHELAGLLRVEETELERLQVRVHAVAQVELDPEGDAAGNQAPRDAEEQPQEPGCDDRGGERPQVRLALAYLIDRAPDEVGDEHAGRHRHGRQREGDDHALPVGAQEAEESPERLQGV